MLPQGSGERKTKTEDEPDGSGSNAIAVLMRKLEILLKVMRLRRWRKKGQSSGAFFQVVPSITTSSASSGRVKTTFFNSAATFHRSSTDGKQPSLWSISTSEALLA